MKRLLCIVFFILLFFIFSGKNAIALEKNNLFGVHILFPEEVSEAGKLVNSGGGDWGYVVIPIQSVDRNREKWQFFMEECRRLHLIPIIRLATYPEGSNWTKPNDFDSVDFANFLSDLNWPTREKLIAVYNEPNHANEWGGEVNPWEYSDVLTDTISQFKKRDKNFVMLNAGLDASSSDTSTSMDEYEFMTAMIAENPDVFRQIDAFNAHSYPNPAFSANPFSDSRFGINSYQYEINYLQDYYGIYGLKVYVTETGWKRSGYLSDEQVANYYKQAYTNVWTDDYIISVSPFLLSASAGDFVNFSLIANGEKTNAYNAIFDLKKIKGTPELIKISNSKIQIPKAKEFKSVEYERPNEKETLIDKYRNLAKKFVKWIFR